MALVGTLIIINNISSTIMAEEKRVNQMEMEAEKRERQIVKFKNIDKERFTHSFRGVSISVDAGIEQIMRLPEADHLATHLARKILSRKRKSNLDAMDRKAILYTQEEVNELKQTIITHISEEQPPEQLNPSQKRVEDVKELNQKFGDKIETPEPTKKDIIKELESRGIKVDPSKSKEELLAQLMEAEASSE